jgi:methylated-DNA-[protein]-cysteine S-methyltransferase
MFAHWTYYESPLGWLCISGNGGSIASIVFLDNAPTKYYSPVPDYLNFAVEQLEEYFTKGHERFDLKIDIRSGTDFQREVWRYLLGIPYGQTTTYSRIAEDLGDKKAVRAIGQAVGANPIAIVVPCHRVIAVDGDLTGFAWGIERKRKLLELEKAALYGVQQTLF